MALTTEQQARLDRLVMLVSLRIDEYLETVQEARDTDVPIGDIEYELQQATRYVLRRVRRIISFPTVKKSNYSYPIENTERKCLVIPLPDDYLRFTRLKIAGWKRSVNSYMSDETSAYRQQIYPQRRGTKEKPVAFLTPFVDNYEAQELADGHIYAEQTGGEGSPAIDDVVTHDGSTAANVVDNTETNFIVLEEAGTYNNPELGDELVHEDNDYTLAIAYKEGDRAMRDVPVPKQALEVYPIADGEIEELVYVPMVPAYDIPVEIEDAVVWRTVSVILQIMRMGKLAQAALQQMEINLNALNTGMIGEEDMQPRSQRG